MIALALVLTLLAPQDAAEQWEQVGTRQGSKGEVVIDVAPASIRRDGMQRHYRMRATSKFSGRIVISNMVADCIANTYWPEDHYELWIEGKLVDTHIVTADETVPRPGDGEPVSTAIMKRVCA